MNRETYIKITDFFRNNRVAHACLFVVYKILPLAVAAAYAGFLVYSFFVSERDFLITLLMPAGVFVLVTVLRVIVNERRPYEKFAAEPVFPKDTTGKSMPSRHTASTFIISFAALNLNLAAGAVMLAASCLIAASRVLSGVHYIRDAAAAAALSTAAAAIVFLTV